MKKHLFLTDTPFPGDNIDIAFLQLVASLRQSALIITVSMCRSILLCQEPTE